MEESTIVLAGKEIEQIEACDVIGGRVCDVQYWLVQARSVDKPFPAASGRQGVVAHSDRIVRTTIENKTYFLTLWHLSKASRHQQVDCENETNEAVINHDDCEAASGERNLWT